MRSPARRLLWLSALLVAACAEPAPVVPTVTAAPAVASPPIETAEPRAALPPFDASLPAGSAGTLAVDVGRLEAILRAALDGLPPDQRARIERSLGLPGDGQLARAMGLDPSRAIVASVGLVGGATTVRERLNAMAGKPPSPELTREVTHVFDGLAGVGVTLRLVFPTADAAATLAVLDGFFTGMKWSSATPPDGVDEMHVDRRVAALAGVSRVGATVVMDAVFLHGEGDAAIAQGRQVLATLRARAPGGPHDEPPPLAGVVAHAHYMPVAMADLGMVMGIAATLRALSGTSIPDEQRDRILAVGLSESLTSFKLAVYQGRPYFDSIDMTVEGAAGSLSATLRADAGSAVEIKPEAWAPSAAPAIAGTMGSLDVSVPWVRWWTPVNADYQTRRELRSAVADAGWVGPLISLPQLFAVEVWKPMEDVSRFPLLVQHADRIGVFASAGSGSDAVVVLLAAGAGPADVACALVTDGAPCTADRKLRPGATVPAGGQFAKLQKVGGRWAVVLGSSKEGADKAKVTLTTALHGPAWGELNDVEQVTARLLLPRTLFGEAYTGEITLEGRQAIARFRPAQRPAQKKAVQVKKATPAKK